MKDRGTRNLAILVVSVGAGLCTFYGFLVYRARRWSPRWAISPTQQVSHAVPQRVSPLDEDSPAARGRRLYREAQCGVCHGVNGEGGVKNPNADTGGMVPALQDLGAVLSWDQFQLRMGEVITKGAQTGKADPHQPAPPLDMPSWGHALSEQELDDLLHYLFSLKG